MNQEDDIMRIGIYPRKSVYRDNSESISVQVKLCKEYAEIMYRDQELEYTIYDNDEGYSGKNTDRPGYARLMSDVRADRLDLVIVYKLDRISRNVQDFSNTFAVFQEHNVGFVSVKESFDTSTPIGRTVMYILAAFAQLERETTSERVSDNMLEMAKSGFWTGGRAPSGMKSIRQKIGGKEHSFLVVDEETIPFVKQMYSLFLSGMSITALERYCKNHGIKALSGKYLSTNQLHFLLTNPVYCQNSQEALSYFQEQGYELPEHAEQLFDGTRGCIGYGRRQDVDTPYTVAIGIHDWVVSGNDWVATQRRMGINKQVRTSKYDFGLLKGVLRCRCGSRCITKIYNQKGKQYRNYLCSVRDRKGAAYCSSRHINMDLVDDLFIQKMKELQFNKSAIVLHDFQEFQEFDEKAAIRKQQAIRSKIANLTAVLGEAEGQASAKYILQQINQLDMELQHLQADIQNGRIQSRIKAEQENNIDYVYGQICYLLDNFEILEYKEKNELIRKIVKECVFDNGNLKIIF